MMNNKSFSYLSNHPSTNQVNSSALFMSIFLFMGFTCFILSLFLPAFYTSAEDIYGYWVLITGWIGAIFIQFAWYANPLNLLALLLARDKPRTALILSFIALTVASATFIFYEIPTGINYEKVFIKEFGLGFYVWYVAQIFFLLALLSRFINYMKGD